jgi:hypothetical protein
VPVPKMSGRVAELAPPPITGYITGHKESQVADTSQKRALSAYRQRLGKKGMARFEVIGLDSDRALIRSVARRLADKGPEAGELRAAVHRAVAPDQAGKGGILAALRRSPLAGAGLAIGREASEGREIDL